MPGMASLDTDKQAVRLAGTEPLPSYSIVPVQTLKGARQQMDPAVRQKCQPLL